ncbi:MAG: hypothetical protein ABR975_03755, partial [Vulcanimicrobiaceae bacterium]
MVRSPLVLLLALGAALLPLPAPAQGEVRIEQRDGSNKVYPGVHIDAKGDTVTFSLANAEHTLVVAGAHCSREDGVRMCSSADVWLERYGVSEELRVTKSYVFVNDTHKMLHVKGSRVDLSPNTLMVEILTQRGTYITGRGWI